MDLFLLDKGRNSIFSHEPQEVTIVRSSFVTTSIEHLPGVIGLSGNGPAGMITDSMPDIPQHVGFFGGVTPVLVLPFPLESAAQNMDLDLFFGAPHGLALFFRVGRVVFDCANLDFVIETDFALAIGTTTKALGRRSITRWKWTVTTPR